MKIALVSPYDYPYPGGVTNHVMHLHREFVAMGHEVRIMAPSSNRNIEREETDVYRIGRVRRVPANGSIARITLSFRLARRVREVLESEQFDVVHVHEPLMPSLPPTVLRYSEALNVGTFHAYRGSYYGYFYGRPVLRFAFRQLDGRIAVSRAAKRFVRQYFMAPYRVIPNGVELARFAPESLEPLPQFCDGRPNILFVGRPEKRKGVGYLLRAYPQVKEAFPDARFIIVGAGDWEDSPYTAYIKRHRLHDIVVVGRVSEDDLPRYLRSADAFCAPATQGESFGIVLLEAMASGVPVVASDIEGYRQVMTQGNEGIMVPPRNERALAEAVCALLQDRTAAEAMGQRGRETARLYSWDRIAEQVVDFYVRTGTRTFPTYAAEALSTSGLAL
ncbi:MAG TPA: glycosyltransferase family 1 protein [Chloroflexi bacterium]|nr:glycosyltransferase family 1 protein [Chloroflexota bacterium]